MLTLHEDYDDISNINEIAIIKMEEKVSMTDYIAPICMPSVNEDLNVGRRCMVTGKKI